MFPVPSLLIVSLVLCFFTTVVDGKVSSGKILLTGENSVGLVTKFAVSNEEDGKFQIELRIPTKDGMYTDERQLRVSVFNEERKSWPKAKKQVLCYEQVKYAKGHYKVVFDSKEISGEYYWVAQVDGILPRMPADMYWYLTLNDCLLENSYHSLRDAPEMEFTYTIMNGESHFSADETGMKKLHIFQIALSSMLLLWIIAKVVKAAASSKGQIHVALLTIFCAILCDILSCASEMIHAAAYAYNGIGSYTFDCFASHFEAQCDALVALVLLLVGAGWTLPSDVLVAGNQNAALMNTNSVVQRAVSGFRSPFMAMQQLKSGNPAALLILMIMGLHAGLAQWGRTFDDDFDTYHSLEHLPGRALMWFRIGLGFAFLVASSSVRNSGRCPRALEPFLKKFQIVGISWFISLPFVSMYVTNAMHPHQKHIALAFCSMLVQSSSLASLAWLFTADKHASPYHRMNNLQTDNETLSGMSLSSSSGSTSNFWKIGKTKIRLD